MLTTVAIIVDGLVYPSWLFIVAVGLTLIFGVMKVLNVAHGGFYSMGAYAAAWSVGIYFDAGLPPAGSFLLLALVGGRRRPRARPHPRARRCCASSTAATRSSSCSSPTRPSSFSENLVLLIWGVEAYPAYQPSALLGTLTIAGLPFNTYELALVPLAGLDRPGAVPRSHAHAVRQAAARRHPRPRDGDGVRRRRGTAVHHHLRRSVRSWARSAAPSPRRRSPWCPGIGVEVIVLAFAVVVTGGLGSVGGHPPRRPDRRARARRRGASAARGRAVRHLRRDDGGADPAAARPFRPDRSCGGSSDHGARCAPCLILAFAVLALASFILPGWAVNLLTLMLARALVILGLLVLWRTGLVSFGQALYYGLGAYAVGLVQKYTGLRDAFALLRIGTLAALADGHAARISAATYRDIFFAMLSLAFSMILYGTLVKSETLGSTDGFAVAVPHFPRSLRPRRRPPNTSSCSSRSPSRRRRPSSCSAISHRPMGHLAVAIRDNEIRVEYLGFPVQPRDAREICAGGARWRAPAVRSSRSRSATSIRR